MTDDQSILISRDHHLGIAVTGPGLDLRARSLAAKAGFVTHPEQHAMVLPPRTDPDEAQHRAGRVLGLLYFDGYAVTLDTTLENVRSPVALPDLGPVTMGLVDAVDALRVMPHPTDVGALLDLVRAGPLPRIAQLLDIASTRTSALVTAQADRDARVTLQEAAKHLAVAQEALTDAAALFQSHAPDVQRRRAVTGPRPAQPAPAPTPIDSRRRR